MQNAPTKNSQTQRQAQPVRRAAIDPAAWLNSWEKANEELARIMNKQ